MNPYSKPRLKSQVEFCVLDNKINFFHRPGLAVQMEDPSGFIVAVCKLLDGKKSTNELKTSLIASFPKEIQYLDKLLIALDKEYLIEDTTDNQPEILTDYDMERWSRNIEFFAGYCKAKENKYSYQEKIKSTKVVILGLGGVGSTILYNLSAMGVSHIKAVDFDTVDLSNLNRQIIYNESDIGQLKTDAAGKRISQFFSNANIEFINKKISSEEDVTDVISDQDILIAAIDYPREKIMDWINAACVKSGVTFLCGSLDSKLVAYYTIVPRKTGCIDCWKISAGKTDLIFQNLVQHEGFVPSNSPNVAIMPFISLIAGFIANEFLKIVTKIAEPQSLGQLCVYDFISSQITIAESWVKNPDCAVCSLQ